MRSIAYKCYNSLHAWLQPQPPHWGEMWYKVEFNVGNPSAYTRAKDQNLSRHFNRGIDHFALSNFLSRVSVCRQDSDWVVLYPKTELDNREPDSGLTVTRCNTRSTLLWRTWAFPPGTLVKIYPTPAKRARVQYWSVFLNLVSIRRQSPDSVTLCSKTEVLSVAKPDSELPDSNMSVFFSDEPQSEDRTPIESSSVRKRSCLVASLGLTATVFFLLTLSSLFRASCLIHLCYCGCLIYLTAINKD